MLLAHMGGAPEAVTFGLPVLVVLGFVVAEKRARARERQRRGDEHSPPEPQLPPVQPGGAR